ncbi:major facilitator superfamily permease [Streptococcus pneumoniae]|nr:major facilitator superfamily permease [Streptococcus pneumoniae]
MKLFWTNNIYRQLLLNSCFSSFGDSIFYLAIINYVAQYNFAPLAILLISISEMVPLLSQLFLGILGDFQENRVKHALCIAKIKILLYAILTVFLVLSPFSLVSVIIPNHSYLSQLDVTYKTPDLMSHFLPPHEVSFTFCCSSIVFPR